MQAIYQRVCGLDVHKKSIMACVRRVVGEGKTEQELRSFRTITTELKALAMWLGDLGVTHVAMESTGVYWKPVYNILERSGRFELALVNAREVRQLPGRKTDVRDCEWIAQLLQCGLLRSSFVPAKRQRELRELTRHRTKLTQEHTAVANRIQAVLEDANIKLASVASDVLGPSGRSMIRALLTGERDVGRLAELARGRLRTKIPELELALDGMLTENHCFQLGLLLEQLEFLESAIERISKRIEEDAPDSFRQAVRRLDAIPGIAQRAAENVLAEIGTDMKPFPTAGHLASWAGLCPGNNESAGKRRTGRTTKGNRWLRAALGEAAWAASRTKNTYPAAQFRRLAARRGRKRAIVAVAHTILVVAFYVLRDGVAYNDLGPLHFERRHPQRTRNYHVRKLQGLGYQVSLLPSQEAA